MVLTSRGRGTEMKKKKLSGAVRGQTQTVGINRMRQIYKHVRAETVHMELPESSLGMMPLQCTLGDSWSVVWKPILSPGVGRGHSWRV